MPHRRTPGSAGLTVHLRYEAWIAVVRVVGDVDAGSVAKLRAAVDEVAHTGHDVLIDLTDCPFIDSSGIAQVLRANALAAAQDAAFAVACADGSIPARVLDIVTSGALDAYPGVPEALAQLHRTTATVRRERTLPEPVIQPAE